MNLPTGPEKPEVGAMAWGEVRIRGATWRVELATTYIQRWVGLGYRDQLASGEGMLFIFPNAEERSFCMCQCRIDLDIAFIGPGARVIRTYAMKAEPDRAGRVEYGPVRPTQWVLEVPRGDLASAGVAVGDKVSFSAAVPCVSEASPDC